VSPRAVDHQGLLPPGLRGPPPSPTHHLGNPVIRSEYKQGAIKQDVRVAVMQALSRFVDLARGGRFCTRDLHQPASPEPPDPPVLQTRPAENVYIRHVPAAITAQVPFQLGGLGYPYQGPQVRRHSKTVRGQDSMALGSHTQHENHAHSHGPSCGHASIEHEEHTDYLHDGHAHTSHDTHVDECAGGGHGEHAGHAAHEHGEQCGHETVAHQDHTDYVHDGHRHAVHAGHYDEH